MEFFVELFIGYTIDIKIFKLEKPTKFSITKTKIVHQKFIKDL